MIRNLIITVVTALLASTANAQDDIVTTAVKAGKFKTLAAALQQAELVSALQGEGPFTVFAPTDEAFAALPKGTVESLLKPKNKAKLQAILKYHVVAGAVPAAKVIGLKGAVTLQGQRVDIKVADKTVMVDGARVVKADIRCGNGIIHVIDKVILPESRDITQVAAGANTFKTLLAAAKAAGLAETLASKGPFTVFAPTDEAFAKLPAGTVENLLKPENKKALQAILLYHVVSGRVYSEQAMKLTEAKTLQGSKVAIGTLKISATDIDASNGVIHVIDQVILPPKSNN
ncbi:MAG: fasciclin domain-containing protein [Planctomycetota bacterium]